MPVKSGMSRDIYTLGIFCYFNDASACLLRNGKLIAMAEEERFDRLKHSYRFPLHAIRFCLREAGIPFSQIDGISYGFKPWKFLWNQLHSACRNFPESLNLLRPGSSFMPFGEKLSGLLGLRWQFYKAFGSFPPKIHYIEHHTAHAYSSFFVSPFEEAAILVMDGFGETFATSFYKGQGSQIKRLGTVPYPNSLGVFYAAITQFLGFRPHSDEYKVMAMAAFGKDHYQKFFQKMLSVNGHMSFRLEPSYISLYTHGIRRYFSEKMERELGFHRGKEDPFEQRHFDITASAQRVFEEVVVHLGRKLQEMTGSRNLCVAGGCAQNVLVNRALLDRCGYERIYVPPVAYDGGISLGSALATYHRNFGGERNFSLDRADWGPGFSDEECVGAIRAKGLPIEEEMEGTDRMACLLAEGKIVGYFQGRMEIGPRALGYRSILADPRRPEMKEILNARVKKREFFRPFAPVIPLEDCEEYFDLPLESPFMTLVARVKKPHKIPAAIHQDGTGRVQTVRKDSNASLHRLLKRFGEMSGVPVLINTSFNENEPIVCTPEEAIDCFIRTRMDALVFNNRYFVLNK